MPTNSHPSSDRGVTRAKQLERWAAYVLLIASVLGAAVLYAGIDAQAAANERELLLRANWLASEFAREGAPAVATGQRERLAQILGPAARTPELDAVVALAASGDTVFAFARRPELIDHLLSLEPGAGEQHVVADSAIVFQDKPFGQLRLALSAERIAGARDLRDRAAGLTLLVGLALAAGLVLWQRRKVAQAPAAKPPSIESRATSSPASAPRKATFDDRLLRSIGREARAALSNTLAMVELLLDTKLDPKQRRHAQTIDQSARSLLGAIDEVLEFARAADGQYPVRRAEFDLRQIVEDCVERFAQEAHQKDLELLCRIDSDVPQFALADEARLRQVLGHVIGNAVKFTERGEVIVHVHVDRSEGVEPRARIEVSDTGPGIPSHEQASVFEGLSGGDELLVRPHRGIGLGLAISKRLVDAMGGQIGVTSAPGAGSTFFLTLPVKAGSKPISLRPIALARRALLVDASRSAREVLRAQIERWQIDCDTTSSAYDAFARLEQEARSPQPFDVMVVAERTSDLSGAELLRALGTQAAIHQVPIVLLTYKGSALGASEIDSVASAQLTKPTSPSALHRCITNVVERRSTSLPARQPTPQPTRSDRPEPLRALVVDDNEINQFAVVELLTELGFAPDVARNGREAVEMVARQDYAIVFMDCEMPEMDGYEATREIRRSLNPSARVPIIALTAHNAPEERDKGMAAGMNEYMAKPVRQDALEATIVRWTSEAPKAASKRPTEPSGKAERTRAESERP